jgi:hypothetical protein
MLRARLGKSPIKLHARKLKVFERPASLSQEFVQKNHLMGSFHAAKSLGLKDQTGELVCLVTYRREGTELEISRMCSKLNTQIVGGVSRLFSHLPLEGVERIVSFVDLRYATGHSLLKLGFELEKITLGWKWTDGKNTYNRLHCRANMDDRQLSQAQHAAELGLRKIYDAGQAKYVKTLIPPTK